MKKLIKLCEIILFLLFLILLPFLKEKLSIFIALPILILFYYLFKDIKEKKFSIILFTLALIIRVLSILYLKVEIVDDYKTMLQASRNLLNGNLDFLKNIYFIIYPYQIGHVLYQALFLKILNKVIILKIVNSIITSFIVLFIYLNSKQIVKEKTARFISFSYLLYFYPVYLNSVLTNQHLPALLILIAIYIMFKNKDSYKYSILIAALLSIANIFRTESIIFIGGIIVYKIITLDKKTYKSSLKNLLIIVLAYFILNTIISNVLYITPLKTKLGSKYPEWKFYCGLSDKYNGIYNDEDSNVFFNTENKKELLINRIKEENIKIPVLFLKKEVILWTQTNYDLRLKNNINNFLLYFNQGYLNVVILLLVITLIPNKKETNKKKLLIEVFLALYYGIYMLIEISPRYAYILHILVFIIIGIGLERIINKIKDMKI